MSILLPSEPTSPTPAEPSPCCPSPRVGYPLKTSPGGRKPCGNSTRATGENHPNTHGSDRPRRRSIGSMPYCRGSTPSPTSEREKCLSPEAWEHPGAKLGSVWAARKIPPDASKNGHWSKLRAASAKIRNFWRRWGRQTRRKMRFEVLDLRNRPQYA